MSMFGLKSKDPEVSAGGRDRTRGLVGDISIAVGGRFNIRFRGVYFQFPALESTIIRSV